MAFDHPIEADRIDDFNLFSAFVRAPLWILGGVLGGKRSFDEEEPVHIRRLDSNDPGDKSLPGSSQNSPSRARVVSDYDMSSDNGGDTERRNNSQHSCEIMHNLEPRQGSILECTSPSGLKRTKNLSWSDESGLNLVEYHDESVRHEPSPYQSVTSTTAPKPVKSALRRSGSVRSGADGMGATKDGTRYIPRMNQPEKGLVMPTRPFGAEAGGNGLDSPQLGYGWYTNLTPPTPEMYYNSSIKPSKAEGSSSSYLQPSGATASGKHAHNQVFQNLQNSQAPMGWTSVPI